MLTLAEGKKKPNSKSRTKILAARMNVWIRLTLVELSKPKSLRVYVYTGGDGRERGERRERNREERERDRWGREQIGFFRSSLARF